MTTTTTTTPTPASVAAALAASLVSATGAAYSGDPGPLSAGQAIALSVVIPSTVPLGTIPAPVVQMPVTATVEWDFGNAGGEQVPPLYKILEGSLWSTALVVAFDPTDLKTQTVDINLSVTVTVAGVSQTVSTRDTPPKTAPGLMPFIFTFPEYVTKAADFDALQVVGPVAALSPGVPGGLELTQAVQQVAGVLTSITNEIPDLKLRGAIPIGALLQGGFSTVESVVGSISGSVAGVVGDVADLLGDNPVLPLALDIQGSRILRSYTPDPTAVAGQLQDGPAGVVNQVPVGSWLMDLPITVQWTVTQPADPFNRQAIVSPVPGSSGKASVLIPPSLDGLPEVWTASARVFYTSPAGDSLAVELPGIPLVQLPLPLPSLLLAFHAVFHDSPQMVWLASPPGCPQLQYSLEALVGFVQTAVSVISLQPSWFPPSLISSLPALNILLSQLTRPGTTLGGWLSPDSNGVVDTRQINGIYGISAWGSINLGPNQTATPHSGDGNVGGAIEGTNVTPDLTAYSGWNDNVAQFTFATS
jgi:hypothetical protein